MGSPGWHLVQSLRAQQPECVAPGLGADCNHEGRVAGSHLLSGAGNVGKKPGKQIILLIHN